MKSKPPRDRAASVRQRLLNLAKERGEEFNFVLIRYGLERLLFRIGQSRHAGTFVLKGAMLFPIWSGSPHRATRDMDLLGTGAPDISRFEGIFREVAAVGADDGVIFLPDTVAGAAIREEAVYEGIRVTLEGRLGVARISGQVDIGFGDAITPAPVEADYPLLLPDMPPPRLRVYPRETAIAEKLEAMVTLGIGNSRMKDFFDIWYLARTFEFDKVTLRAAVAATFERRRTMLPSEVPSALTTTFATDPVKAAQWRAFLARSRTASDAPSLSDTVAALVDFLGPLFPEGGTQGDSATWKPKVWLWQ